MTDSCGSVSGTRDETVSSSSDKAEIIALPPVIFASFLLAGIGAAYLWPIGFTWDLRQAGAALLALAIANASWAVVVMKRARTTIDPRHPTTAIVTEGPFSYSRNPLYLSLALIFVGVSACMDSLTTLAFVVPFLVTITKGVIVREERYLAAKFGDAYLDYRATVRRWL